MIDLRFYLSLFLRRIHWFLLFLILGTAAGLTVASVLPPTYRASSTLIVESPQIPTDMAESTVRTETSESLQIIRQRILTRDRLLEMANRLQIYSPQERAEMNGDEMISDLRSRIRIDTSSGRRGQTQATMVEVSFQASSGRTAATVVNEVVSRILQENVALRTAVANETLQFFDEEVARLDREISAKNAEILAFQEQNLSALPDSLDFRRAQQSTSQNRLAELERDEDLLRDRRDALIEVYERTGQVGPASQSGLSPQQRQLQELRDQLTRSLATLSSQNPRVRMLQAQIAGLEAQIASSSVAADDTETDPQQAALQIQLTDIDTQIEAIVEEKERVLERMTSLQASIDATPANAIRLDTLRRDAGALRSQYEQAVRSRAEAETGETIETLSKGQRITVVEPAIAPSRPESPDRPRIAAAGVAGGAAAGLAVVLLIELLNKAVRRPIDIQNGLGIQPLGTLPYIRTRAEIWRRRVILGSAFATVAIGVPIGLWWVHTYVAPLDLLLDRVLERVLDRIRLAADPYPVTVG